MATGTPRVESQKPNPDPGAVAGADRYKRTRSVWEVAARVGLIGGVSLLYLSLVGIIGRFEDRPVIHEVIGLGRTLILIVALASGYVAARKLRRRGTSTALALPGGALAGAVAGALGGLLVIVTDAVNVQRVFVALTPRLLNVLTFGQDPVPGAFFLAAVAAVVGLLGAGLVALPSRVRRAVVAGLVTILVVAIFEPLFRPILRNLGLNVSWLYRSGDLTPVGAIVVGLVAMAIDLGRLQARSAVRERVDELPPARRRALRIGGIVFLLAFAAYLPILAGGFVSNTLVSVGLYILLGLGLNIVVGYAGLLDLGYVAFFAVGAYSIAIFTSRDSFLVVEQGRGVASLELAEAGQMTFWAALPLALILAVVLGVMIGAPVLRLRGDYLAIVTLGFGEIVRTLVLSDWLTPVLGGAQGIIQVPAPPPASWDLRDPERLYYLLLAFVVLATYVSVRLKDSRVGRAWAAMREDESVAEAMGISVIKYKLLAFAMGAAVGSLGGMFFAAQIGSVFPSSFRLLVSINVLAVLVLGGMGSIPGVIVGALVLVGLPEVLREFAEYRLLLYGAILVAIMVLRPEGLFPEARRRRELHVVEEESEQFERRVGEESPAPVVLGGSPEGGPS